LHSRFSALLAAARREKKNNINEEHAPNNMITTSMNRLRNLAHESYTSTSVNQIYLPPHLTTTTSNPENS
jgi:hypothetical protein